MARLLARISERADLRNDVFLNDRGARSMVATQIPTQPDQRIRFEFRRGIQFLLAGNTETAIPILQSTLAEAEGNPGILPGDLMRRLKSTLAIAYLRLGEQENCLAGQDPERCLFPIAGGGIHTARQGSAAAVPLYLALLEEDPEDLNARWLLNLAYMTLGTYPTAVPPRWLIPAEVFDSGFQLPRFAEIAKRTGTDIMGLAGGVVSEDFNGDGLVDILCTSWGLSDPMNYLENTPTGVFRDRSGEAGLAGIVGGLNMVQADYDNDGRIDVFVLRGAWRGAGGRHPNSLLRNLGGRFADVTEAAGLLDFSPSQTAAWADFDRDGWLDLFVGAESTPNNRQTCKLFHNNGDGSFSDVTRESGLDVSAFVKAVVWGDVDNDGFADLYLSILDGGNMLFRNVGIAAGERGWTFENITARAGVAEPRESFPAWFFDYDNDGWLDLFVSGYDLEFLTAGAATVAGDYLGRPKMGGLPKLYHNLGNGRFEDVTDRMGLNHVYLTMGCAYGDLDNDGWSDFYLGTGAPDFQALIPNQMLRNDGGRMFQNVTTAGGFGHLQKGHAIAFADFDNDGDQDIYAVMGGAYSGDLYPNALFQNPGNRHRFVTLILEGVASSRDAIGARLKVRLNTADGARDIHAVLSSGTSFGGSTLRQEIGLGDADAIEYLEIQWPVSGVQRVAIPELDRAYRIREGDQGATQIELPRIRLGGARP